jgi:hypothetical protein
MDGWTNECMNGWIDGWRNECVHVRERAMTELNERDVFNRPDTTAADGLILNCFKSTTYELEPGHWITDDSTVSIVYMQPRMDGCIHAVAHSHV